MVIGLILKFTNWEWLFLGPVMLLESKEQGAARLSSQLAFSTAYVRLPLRSPPSRKASARQIAAQFTRRTA